MLSVGLDILTKHIALCVLCEAGHVVQRATHDEHYLAVYGRLKPGASRPQAQGRLDAVAARLRHVAGTKWGTRRYLDMTRLRATEEAEPPEAAAAV